ncbi:MAG: MFS transporter [Deltaproteobacteria bacterium]|nr:MFS transporter [Deltaproteobacteria bacterium]
MTDENKTGDEKKPNPLREIVQPFIDVVHAPRALWGVNVSYLLEGFCYFGVIGYLAMYFNNYVGLTDTQAGPMVGVLTWGITLSMFFFGGRADKWGVRTALIAAMCLMIVGRVILASGPFLELAGGMWSPLFFMSLVALLFVILGYGMYQPAAYAAIRQFTTPKTAGMGYAMLYALMNLGGWLPTWFTPIRKAVGISGAYWVYVGFTVLGTILLIAILSRKTVERAIAEARAAGGKTDEKTEAKTEQPKEPFSLLAWLKNHPLADKKFAFFIFALIPVQTLFAHNWLTLPMYVERAYRGTWIGDHFEAATNFNPILIFILVPMVAAITQKRKVYNMMIAGTAVMAAPTFLLAIGPSFSTLLGYLVLMTVGEAMWQPRFLQYAAEIAPEGRTGAYMGVAQFPWFLTKVITSLYSGWFLANYCPKGGTTHTETMWLIYGCIAMCSTVLLILARGWLGKDFKTKAA